MLIILDWDGTLIDSADRIAECLVMAGQTLEQFDIDTEHAKQVIGLGLDEAIAQLYPYLDQQQLKRCKELYIEYFLAAEQTPSELFANVEQTLDELRSQGHLLAIATGKSRRGLNRVLQQLDMEHYFDASRCADETRSKPDPMMLHELMDEFEYEPQHCLMVGDTVFDLEMAEQAGIAAVAVNYGVHAEDALLAREPMALIDNFAQLVNVIEDFQAELQHYNLHSE